MERSRLEHLGKGEENKTATAGNADTKVGLHRRLRETIQDSAIRMKELSANLRRQVSALEDVAKEKGSRGKNVHRIRSESCEMTDSSVDELTEYYESDDEEHRRNENRKKRPNEPVNEKKVKSEKSKSSHKPPRVVQKRSEKGIDVQGASLCSSRLESVLSSNGTPESLVRVVNMSCERNPKKIKGAVAQMRVMRLPKKDKKPTVGGEDTGKGVVNNNKVAPVKEDRYKPKKIEKVVKKKENAMVEVMEGENTTEDAKKYDEVNNEFQAKLETIMKMRKMDGKEEKKDEQVQKKESAEDLNNDFLEMLKANVMKIKQKFH